ncbi:MAG TPA: ABC transporter substrate-binding protein [Planctomycetes bacterium]|nr:ABC transporter substrate-binding protein [Planctomycetota bacterium]
MRTLFTVLGALALLLPFSCKPSNASSSESPRDVLIYGRGKDSISLDPAAASDGESTKVMDNVYETLVDFSEDPARPAELIPCLATSWEEGKDRLQWTFYLRKGVRFHDGTPFDAQAAKFSLDRLISGGEWGPQTAPYRGNFVDVKEIQAQGSHTLVIRLRRPSVVLLRNLAMFCASIVSPTAVKKEGRQFGDHPVGTGPYRLQSWKKDVRVTLTRNEDWWGDFRPKLRTIVFLQVRDWPSRRVQLEAGELHMVDNVVFQDIQNLNQAKGVEVQVKDGMNVCYLTLNNEKPPFDHPLVRKAVAMAMDRARIVSRGYFDFARPARDLIPPTIPGHSEDVAPPEDLDGAKSLLHKAGFKPGTSVELRVMNNPRPYLMEPDKVAELLRDQLAKIGFVVRIKKLDWASYLRGLQEGEHQMALIGWTTDNGDPDNFYGPLLSGDLVGGTNYSRMRNAQFDALLREARGISDPKARVQAYAKIQDILRKECPLVPLVYTKIASAYRSDVKGFVRHPIKIRLARVYRE